MHRENEVICGGIASNSVVTSLGEKKQPFISLMQFGIRCEQRKIKEKDIFSGIRKSFLEDHFLTTLTSLAIILVHILHGSIFDVLVGRCFLFH